MELYPPIYGNSLYPFLLPPTYLYSLPQNYVHWNRTPESHIYTVDLPGISQLSSQLQSFDTEEDLSVNDSSLFRGVRKEEIRVEVEDGRYLVIRTELDDDDDEEMEMEGRGRRSFMRKFRLPEMVDVERISAGYEDGVLTVRVPRRLLSRRPRVEDIVIDRAAEERNSVARAA